MVCGERIKNRQTTTGFVLQRKVAMYSGVHVGMPNVVTLSSLMGRWVREGARAAYSAGREVTPVPSHSWIRIQDSKEPMFTSTSKLMLLHVDYTHTLAI